MFSPWNTQYLLVLNEGDDAPTGCAVSVVNESLSVYLKLQGVLNVEAEREKLRKKMEEIRKLVHHPKSSPLTGKKNHEQIQFACVFLCSWLRSHAYIFCRQKEHLTQITTASGYQDKVPPRIHEENVAKLLSLMQELLSFEQASQHLEHDIAAEQESH